MSESYEAAAWLLRNSCLSHLVDRRVLNDTSERIDLAELHSCALSSGERVIVEAAQALYNGFGTCSLSEAIANLDDGNYVAFVEALRLRRPGAFTTNLIGAN